MLLFFCSFSINVVSFGMSLNTSNLTGNIYINCFISAIIESVAYVVNWPLIKWFARPTVISSAMVFSGVMLMIIQLVPEGHYPLCNVIIGTRKKLYFCEILHFLCVHTFYRHAGGGAGASLRRKDGCLLFFRGHIPVFDWAHPHCGQEHGPRRHYYSVTHRHRHQSIHSLPWQVFFVSFFCWLSQNCLTCYLTHQQLTSLP